MSAFKTLDDLDVAGKTVLVRGDLNVPVKNGTVTDTTRLDRLAPTLLELADKGAKVVVMSHFGRPKGQRNLDYSLEPVVPALSTALGGKPVAFATDCIGEAAEQAVAALQPGGFLVLENLRFYPDEEKNDAGFAEKLAALGDIYVNDAFATAHRAHASTEAIARVLPAAAGRLMQAELEALTNALESPQRPVAAVVGGAKISTKLDLLGNMVSRVNMLILGGGMANTFLYASGIDVGGSLCEKDMADAARAIMETAKNAGCEIVLPSDAVIAGKLEAGVETATVPSNAVPSDKMILDVGPGSIVDVNAKLDGCKTIVWNGPLGAFETAPFDVATTAVAQHAAELTKAGKVLSVAGGGDTVAALDHAGVIDEFSYVSTAGGAFLEWLEGKDLPGVAALKS
ncbi:MAG: phosphoglycerate kinase [Rhodospirillaceae bacterium]|nr:phosphoglycerate kinase [Rhodospirillaceae bacterium]MCA8932227.1 phosphoglycerate kinase [Rhodospirillaceae bacterium]